MFIPIEEPGTTPQQIAIQQGPRGLSGWLIVIGIQLWGGLLTSLVVLSDPESFEIGLAFVAVHCFLLHHYHTCRASFRIWFPVISIAFIAIGMLGSETGAEALGALIGGSIWPLYVVLSRRSRNTFVEGE